MELFGNQMCQAMFAQKWNYLVIKSVKLLLVLSIYQFLHRLV